MENYFNCIYCYTNKINGKKYVGQAVNFKKRHQQHCCNSFYENSIDYNLPFHRAIRKYGIENFEINILKENLTSQCLLNFWESYYIDKFDSLAKNQKGYNVASGGFNGYSCAGKTEEEMIEIRNKMSEAKKDKPRSDETRQQISKTMKSKNLKRTEEHKRKVSEANKGKRHSQEAKVKISEANKGNNTSKLIDRYTTEGEYVDSGYRFEFVEMGFPASSITRCCLWYKCKQDINEYNKIQKGVPRKTIGRKNDDKRYVFIYHDNDFTNEEIKFMIESEKMIYIGNKGQLIDRFDLDGNYIDTLYQFEYANMGFNRRRISTCCVWYACGENKEEFHKIRKGEWCKSHKGFIFKYHVED